LAPTDPQVFIDGGWWVVGPYPEDLKATSPLRRTLIPPDPWPRSVSRPGESGLNSAGGTVGRLDLREALAPVP
jgi:hypothetical protein